MCFMVNSSPHSDSLSDISFSRIKSTSLRLKMECSSIFTIILICEKWNASNGDDDDVDLTLDNIKTSLSLMPGGMHMEMVAPS